MDLTDQGRIKRMVLPDGWKETFRESEDEGNLSFVSPDHKDVKLSFYYRGKPVSDRTAARFRVALEKSPHDLEADELRGIEVVVRDASEPHYFKFKSARTDDINGVRLLLIEGYWILSDADCLGLFVDTKGDGKTVDEIYYVAPPAEFDKHLSAIMKSLKSIEWK